MITSKNHRSYVDVPPAHQTKGFSIFIFNECQVKLDRLSIHLEEEY